MSVRTHEPNGIISALLAALPPSEQLTTRTREALASLGATLVFDLYEMVRGGPAVIKATAAKAEKKPNLLADRWSKADIAFLRENCLKMSLPDIASKLGRTAKAVEIKAHKLELKRNRISHWSTSDIDYLKKNFSMMPLRELASALGRTGPAVDCKARKLGLFSFDAEQPQQGARWSDGEIDYLREHNGDDPADIAAALGRSVHSVYAKFAALRISRKRVSEEIRARNSRISELRSKGLKNAQIRERLGVSDAVIRSANGAAP